LTNTNSNTQINTVSILGCGWLGKKLGSQLINENKLVLGSTTDVKNFETLKQSKIKPYKIDLSKSPNKDFKEFFASANLIISISPKGNTEKFIASFQKLINYLKEQKLYPKIILLSSIGIYEDELEYCSESSATRKNHLYQAEQQILDFQPNACIFRLAGLIGEGREPINFFKGKEISNSNWPINLVNSSDVIDAIKIAIAKEPHGVYNICSSFHPSKGEYYNGLRKAKNLEKLVEVENKNQKGKIVINKKFEEEFGYKFSETI
jgi:nucleoside-diphosphate-sugar epimerase